MVESHGIRSQNPYLLKIEKLTHWRCLVWDKVQYSLVFSITQGWSGGGGNKAFIKWSKYNPSQIDLAPLCEFGFICLTRWVGGQLLQESPANVKSSELWGAGWGGKEGEMGKFFLKKTFRVFFPNFTTNVYLIYGCTYSFCSWNSWMRLNNIWMASSLFWPSLGQPLVWWAWVPPPSFSWVSLHPRQSPACSISSIHLWWMTEGMSRSMRQENFTSWSADKWIAS